MGWMLMGIPLFATLKYFKLVRNVTPDSERILTTVETIRIVKRPNMAAKIMRLRSYKAYTLKPIEPM